MAFYRKTLQSLRTAIAASNARQAMDAAVQDGWEQGARGLHSLLPRATATAAVSVNAAAMPTAKQGCQPKRTGHRVVSNGGSVVTVRHFGEPLPSSSSDSPTGSSGTTPGQQQRTPGQPPSITRQRVQRTPGTGMAVLWVGSQEILSWPTGPHAC